MDNSPIEDDKHYNSNETASEGGQKRLAGRPGRAGR